MNLFKSNDKHRELVKKERIAIIKKVIALLLTVYLLLATSSTYSPLTVQAESFDDGVLWLTETFDEVWPFKEGLAAVYKGGKLGYVDKTGKVVIPLKYLSEEIPFARQLGYFPDISFHDGMALLSEYDENEGYKYGYADKSGKIVIPFEYSMARNFTEGLAAVKKDGKWGYIDKTGKVVIPFIYDEALIFSEGLAPVATGMLWGYIDKTGEMVISQKYLKARPFYEGLAAVEFSYFKLGFIDKNGNKVIEPKYEYCHWYFTDGLACVIANSKYGIIDKTGNEITPLKYDYIFGISEGMMAVRIDNKYGYIDKTGKEIIPVIYDSAGSFQEGLADVAKDGKQGYIDKTGKVVIPFKNLTSAWGFSEGLAVVLTGSNYKDIKLGFIDRTGNQVVPIQYDYVVAAGFSEGVSWVKKDGRWGILTNPLKPYSKANPIFRTELDIAENLSIVTDALKGKNLTKPITREEFAELAVKYYEIITGRKAEPYPVKVFKDCDNQEILKAYNLKITFGVGDGTKFEPKSYLSRQQMAAMITRTLQACYEGLIMDVDDVPDFLDQNSIASYASVSTKFMSKYKITFGDGKGNFMPNDLCTCEQAIAFLIRAYHNKDSYWDTSRMKGDGSFSSGAGSINKLIKRERSGMCV